MLHNVVLPNKTMYVELAESDTITSKNNCDSITFSNLSKNLEDFDGFIIINGVNNVNVDLTSSTNRYYVFPFACFTGGIGYDSKSISSYIFTHTKHTPYYNDMGINSTYSYSLFNKIENKTLNITCNSEETNIPKVFGIITWNGNKFELVRYTKMRIVAWNL